jgi:hypothetical protein
MKRLLTTCAATVLCAACVHCWSGALSAQPPAQPAQPKSATKPAPARVVPRTSQDRTVDRVPRHGGQSNKPAFGPRTVDIRDFGAVPGTDCTVAIQRAYDSCYAGGIANAAGNRTAATLHIPSGTWFLSSPLMFDATNISVNCEAGAVLSMYHTNTAAYHIYAGVKRAAIYGGAWTGTDPVSLAGNRFDMWNSATPKLDSSVITGPNQKWALCSRGAHSHAPSYAADHFVTFYGTPPANGASDHWTNTRKFCVELAYENLNRPRVLQMGRAQGGAARAITLSLAASAVDGAYNGQVVTITGGTGAGQSMLINNYTGATRLCDTDAHWTRQPDDTSMYSIQTPAVTPICGFGSPEVNYMGPWTLASDGARFIFSLATAEGVPCIARSFSFGNAALTGVQKLWIQIDLTANTAVNGQTVCKITAAQNATQASVVRRLGTRYQYGRHTLNWAATGGTFAYTGTRPDTNTVGTINIAYNAQYDLPTLQAQLDTIYGAGNSVPFQDPDYSSHLSIRFVGALADASVSNPKLGSTNLTGVTIPAAVIASEPGFNASNGLHLPATSGSFDIFGNVVNGRSRTPMAPLRLYGFKLSNNWLYTDEGASHAEHRVDNAANTDALRYFSKGSVATDICWLPLDEPPNDSTKTWDGLVKVALATGGGALKGYGRFVVDGTIPQSGSDVGGQGYSGVTTLPANYGAGGGILCYNLLPAAHFTGCYFNGGWDGMVLFGGYDYSIASSSGRGVNSCLTAMSCALTLTGAYRFDAGTQVFLLGSCNVYAEDSVIKTANFNAAGQTTDSIIRILGTGQFGHVYKFGAIETDFEDGANPGCPIVHADLIRDIPTPYSSTFSFKNILTNNLAPNNPIFLFTGSSALDPTQGEIEHVVWIEKITLSDGFDVSVDGPNWHVFVKDSTTSLDAEVVRFAGPGPNPQGHVEYCKTVDALPSAGRFQAGSIRLRIWNPTPGSPAEYVCTTSGTAAWNPRHKYLGNPAGPIVVSAYVQVDGVEYRCITTNTNVNPPASVKAITGATNASPIVITAVGHGLTSGQFVVIAGVGGNTAANGTWTIDRIDADHYTIRQRVGLPVGNGAYTSGGTSSGIWAPTGRKGISAPVWKAVSTVAP